jgi:hypothetical protein
MDPAVFSRLTRQRGWSAGRYRDWIAAAIARLLTGDAPSAGDRRAGHPDG